MKCVLFFLIVLVGVVNASMDQIGSTVFFISSAKEAVDPILLVKNNISLILNFAAELRDLQYPNGIQMVELHWAHPVDQIVAIWFNLRDGRDSSFFPIMRAAGMIYHSWNEQDPSVLGIPNRKILLHCYAGVSRSAAAAVYLLSRENQLTTDQAYHLVKSSRPQTRINPFFWRWLKEEFDKHDEF